MNDHDRPEENPHPSRRRTRARRRAGSNQSRQRPKADSPPESLGNHQAGSRRKPSANQPSVQQRRRRGSATGRRAPQLSIVIPLFNEVDSLRELHRQISAALKQSPIAAEMIFVDDGSDDGSFEVLSNLRQRDRRVRAIQFRRNYGKSAALAVGFDRARGKYVVTMDADLQDDPMEIQNLLGELEKGYDLVSGWKRQRRDPFIKRVASKIFNRVTALLTGLPLHDINCGLKVYRREVTQSIPVYGELHRFLPVLAAKEGFRVSEVEVKHHARKYGRSKFGPSRYAKGFLDLLTVMFLTRYTKRPLHLFGLAGTLSFLTGFGISAYLAFQRIFSSVYLTNRPLIFLGILLMIIGIQLFSIGLIGEMITASDVKLSTYSIRTELGFDRK